MRDIVAALGLVMALEGALYALAPRAMRGMMRRVVESDSEALRLAGLVALALGVGIVWLVRST